jgi:hypothetical protein
MRVGVAPDWRAHLSRMKLRLLRGLAGATTLALLATAMLSAPAMAANGRNVYFGSPDGSGGGYAGNGDLVFGTLTNTRVTAGNRSAVVLLIRNDDNQTLNHVKVAGGAAADGKPYNPGFAKPAGTSLPSGASFATVTVLSGPAGITCNPNTSASFECNIGTLAANASASFQIVINAPATNGAHPYWFTGSWNEGWSSTGNNADYNFAVDNLDVEATSCGAGTATWVLGTETVNLGDGGGTCFNQNAAIKSGAPIGGIGGFASVAVDSTFAATCPAGFRCFGNTVSVNITNGLPVAGGVEWSITWFGTKSMKGVIHFGDDYATDPTDFTVITFNKQSKCSAAKLTDCWKTLTTTNKPASVTAVYVTAGNGKGGGWI